VAQHAAYRAKVDYHQAIRRLHAAGGSLREIAEALRLSHQRVHQIIDEAAEPTRRWWRRRGRPRGPVGPCSFCGRTPEECAKLIAGPGVFICDRCVAQATRLSAGGVVGDRAEAPMRLEPPGSEAQCSFCGKNARQGCSWSPAGCRPRLAASSARAPGSATSAWTCAWRFWPRPRLPEPRRVQVSWRGSSGGSLVCWRVEAPPRANRLRAASLTER
jgi:hypothetical protein